MMNNPIQPSHEDTAEERCEDPNHRRYQRCARSMLLQPARITSHAGGKQDMQKNSYSPEHCGEEKQNRFKLTHSFRFHNLLLAMRCRFYSITPRNWEYFPLPYTKPDVGVRHFNGGPVASYFCAFF